MSGMIVGDFLLNRDLVQADCAWGQWLALSAVTALLVRAARQKDRIDLGLLGSC